jgi:hypothetical protein
MSEIVGKVLVKGEVKTFGDKGFQKQDFVVVTDEKYPQSILVEFQQDNCDLTKPFNIGDDVKIGVNLRGRSWESPQGETKYFNSIVGWRIEKVSGDKPAPFEAAPTTLSEPDDNLDLPF